jgi:hypothetical protein
MPVGAAPTDKVRTMSLFRTMYDEGSNASDLLQTYTRLGRFRGTPTARTSLTTADFEKQRDRQRRRPPP